MAEILPLDRQIVIARELTKLHETIVKTSSGNALALVEQNDNMRKGEFVVIVDGAVSDKKEQTMITAEQEKILSVLLRECSIKTAVAMAVEITGVRKKLLYEAALAMGKSIDT